MTVAEWLREARLAVRPPDARRTAAANRVTVQRSESRTAPPASETSTLTSGRAVIAIGGSAAAPQGFMRTAEAELREQLAAERAAAAILKSQMDKSLETYRGALVDHGMIAARPALVAASAAPLRVKVPRCRPICRNLPCRLRPYFSQAKQ